MGSSRILVAEDPTTGRLAQQLAEQGYRVQGAATGDAALVFASLTPPEVIILDASFLTAGLFQFCDALREWSQTPIIVISAEPTPRHKVEILDHGADVCLDRPFELDELLAHIRVVLRRVPRELPAPVLECGPLWLDQVSRRVTVAGHEVCLTPTEYAILRYLMTHAGKTVTHRHLLRVVWGDSYTDATATLRVFIGQLRRKIEPKNAAPRYIRTVPRIGYRLVSS